MDHRVLRPSTLARCFAPALAALALLAWATRPAHAETSVCTALDTLPATISAPGTYCLQKDFVAGYNTSDTLRIASDDVVLDCNNHRVTNTNAANTTTGIYVSSDRNNVTVRNCQLDGFILGIFVQGVNDGASTGNVVEDNLVLRSRQTGIWVIGSHNRVERNRISGNTGNVNGVARGISVSSSYSEGVGNVVRDNVITDFRPAPPPGTGSSAEGINFNHVRGTEISGNTILGIYTSTSQGVWGIIGSTIQDVVIARNVVMSPPPLAAPLDGGNWGGIRIDGTAQEQAGYVCRDNVVGHFNANFFGCGVLVDNTSL